MSGLQDLGGPEDVWMLKMTLCVRRAERGALYISRNGGREEGSPTIRLTILDRIPRGAAEARRDLVARIPQTQRLALHVSTICSCVG